MINGKTINAVIPVRAGSRRLQNKNILPFGDSNLLIHKIRQLKQVSLLDKIIVSSDSKEMLKMAKNEGVETQERPVEYCDEKTKSFNEVVEFIAKALDCDILMWAPCVCPLCMSEDYINAINTYKEAVLEKEQYDSVISTEPFKKYLYDGKKPVNYIPDKHVPSQYLPDWKTVVNGFYIAPRVKMAEWKYIYGKKPYLYEISKKAAIDIDDEVDYIAAKALFDSSVF